MDSANFVVILSHAQVAIFCPPSQTLKHPDSSSQQQQQQDANEDIFTSGLTGSTSVNRRPRKPSYPQYIMQYLTKSGEWLPDLSRKATCTHDKLEILRHCQRLYPDKDITNIVEANRAVKIGNLCKISGNGNNNAQVSNVAGGSGSSGSSSSSSSSPKVKCIGRDENRNGGVWVTPYRCLG